MLDDPTDDAQLGSPMKVGELIARLKNVNPDFLIVIGSNQSLFVVNPTPGFCLPEELEQEPVAHFTKTDLKFLRQIHIK